jgi:hypothetical protein
METFTAAPTAPTIPPIAAVVKRDGRTVPYDRSRIVFETRVTEYQSAAALSWD